MGHLEGLAEERGVAGIALRVGAATAGHEVEVVNGFTLVSSVAHLTSKNNLGCNILLVILKSNKISQNKLEAPLGKLLSFSISMKSLLE